MHRVVAAIAAPCAAACRPDRQRPVAAVFLALGVMACQSDDAAEDRRGTQLRDSAGIRIVENPAPPAGSRLGWLIGPGPSVSIGSRDGEDPYLLYRASDATILVDGRIVVANGGSGELRFFDSAGSHLASRGGQGEGPGEILQLRSLEPWPGDSIAAWFGPRQNISVFDSGGNYPAFLTQASRRPEGRG